MEYLATLAPGHIFGPTRVQGNASHVNTLLSLLLSCGFGSWHRVWFCFNQLRVGGEHFCSEADSFRVKLQWPLPVINAL